MTPKRKRYSKQQILKRWGRRCFFCGMDDYAVLDPHRIIPGEDGGVYHERNTVIVCANCHRRIHAGQIKIDRKYLSTSGKWLLHYWIEGQEYWE